MLEASHIPVFSVWFSWHSCDVPLILLLRSVPIPSMMSVTYDCVISAANVGVSALMPMLVPSQVTSLFFSVDCTVSVADCQSGLVGVQSLVGLRISLSIGAHHVTL